MQEENDAALREQMRLAKADQASAHIIELLRGRFIPDECLIGARSTLYRAFYEADAEIVSGVQRALAKALMSSPPRQ